MKILVISNLYPNKKEPHKAQFHKQQFRELSRLCELRVIAPLPLFKHSWEDVPYKEITDGIKIYHPRYLVIPKLFRSLYWLFFFAGVLKSIKNIHKTFKFDLVFTLWAYPDGVAGYLISRVLGKPHVTAALGSDINMHGRYLLRRKIMAYALSRSRSVISVSEDLKNKMLSMGVSEEKITVVANGVDADLFRIMDKISCRKTLALPLDKTILLYAGNLERVKGVDLLVEAVKNLNSNFYLVLVGNGKLGKQLKKKVKDFGIEDRVLFADPKPHKEIPLWINAADVFCLPSRNEGCPNVILEALACGKPVVAARVGGIPEIIVSEDYGVLVLSQNSQALAEGIQKALKKSWDLKLLREKGAEKTWQKNAKTLFDELQNAISAEGER